MRRCRVTMITAVTTVLLMAVPGRAQRAVDLSGQWVLVSATTTASRNAHSGVTEGVQRPTTSVIVSGAPFNCGRKCTILHAGETLVVERADLGSADPAPTVTLQLDGRQAIVTDSVTPKREILTTAMWKGEKLEITASTGSTGTTQVVFLNAKQLVVVTSSSRGLAEVTFRYDRKPALVEDRR